MTPEEIDELLKKPLEERRAMAYGREITVMTWHGDSREHVAGCFGRFDVAERMMGVWGIASLSPIEPPKPKRVRFEIAPDDRHAILVASDVEEYYATSHEFTHECKLDDCYKPGESLCSFREFVRAGGNIINTGKTIGVGMGEVPRYSWFDHGPSDAGFDEAWNKVRRFMTKLVREKEQIAS